MSIASQNARLLARLKAGKTITFIDAEAMGIHRCSARIYDLKSAGHKVKDTWIKFFGTRMKAYYMGVK